jgi:hypothetical protein
MHNDCSHAMKKVFELKAKLLNRMEEDYEWDLKELARKFKKLTLIERKIDCQKDKFALVYSMYGGWNVSLR